MIEGHHRQLGRKVAGKAAGPLAGKRVAPEVVQKLMKSKKLLPIEKGCMLSIVAEGLWTQSRLVEKGYVVDVLCKLCKEAPDTLFHRLYVCKGCRAERLKVAKPAFIREALRAGPDDPLYCKGWFEHPTDQLPLPSEALNTAFQVKEGDNWVQVEDKQALDVQGQVYLDGSFTPHLLKGLGRAGWGMVK
eukprot:16440225-Heterocapsa_arctica.AAC.1